MGQWNAALMLISVLAVSGLNYGSGRLVIFKMFATNILPQQERFNSAPCKILYKFFEWSILGIVVEMFAFLGQIRLQQSHECGIQK